MKILAVDIGTGTQDILLFDSRKDIENSLKMVQPSPTMIAHRRIKEATQKGAAISLTGVTMGGGPSHWAVEGHLSAGLPVYATPDAARSFNDDLDLVKASGIQVVSEEEAMRLPVEVVQLELKDFNFEMIEQAFAQFDISLMDLDVIAAAVFDHGAAPPGYSDRQFRFDYIAERIRKKPLLSSFAFFDKDIPPIMTRMAAVADTVAAKGFPLVVMDTAPAAVLGAMQDPLVIEADEFLMTNVGNFHTIGFQLAGEEIRGVFEHHTGMLDTLKLDRLLKRLGEGKLTHEEVFNDHGHGALTISPMKNDGINPGFGVVATGPRRRMMTGSLLRPHFAAPHGDMMMAGCFGLVKATAECLPDFQGEIEAALNAGREKPPWELS